MDAMIRDAIRKLPVLLTREAADSPIAKGVERVLNSLATAIDRGELAPAFLTLGGGLGLESDRDFF